MAQKVRYNVINRPRLDVVGRTDVILDKDGVTTPMGYILKPRSVNRYEAYDLEGKHLDVYSTRKQAGHAIKNNFQGIKSLAFGQPNTESIEAAAQRLCGSAKNPVAALRKRISRGKVKTTLIGGQTMVVID